MHRLAGGTMRPAPYHAAPQLVIHINYKFIFAQILRPVLTGRIRQRPEDDIYAPASRVDDGRWSLSGQNTAVASRIDRKSFLSLGRGEQPQRRAGGAVQEGLHADRFPGGARAKRFLSRVLRRRTACRRLHAAIRLQVGGGAWPVPV